MNTPTYQSFLRRGTALALAAAGGLAFAGCAESSRTAFSAAGNIGPDTQVGGPDASAGVASSGQVRVVSGTATAPADDFAIGNEAILAAFDSVGFDQAALGSPVVAASFTKGSPLFTVIAPSGGNLVDLGQRGVGNDQLPIRGMAFLGLVGFQSDGGGSFAPILNDPFNNFVTNYEVLTDLDPAAGALGVSFSPNIRRVIVRGVVMGSSGSKNAATGSVIKSEQNFLSGPSPLSATATKQTPAGPASVPGTVKAQFAAAGAAVPASLQLPQAFIENLPDAYSLVTVTNTALGIDVPIFVNTIYSIRSGTNYMTMTTVVVNGGSSSVAFAGVLDIWNTGAYNKNNDVLAATTLVPSRDLHLTSSTIPSVVGSSSPNDPTSTAFFSGAPQGVAPYVSFMGRDEPGISYTEFDPNVGVVGFNRPATAFAGVIQGGATTIAAGGTSAWLRNISIGGRNDAASSTDHAIATLAASTVRVNPATGLPLPNMFVSAAHVEGEVHGATKHGGIVAIDEVSPALFFTGPTGTPANKFVTLGTIRRTTARFGPDGRWSATLPSGVRVDALYSLTGSQIDSGVTYRIRAFTDGGGQSASADFVLGFGQGGDIHAPSLDVANIGTFAYRIVDDTLNVVTPARLTFKGVSPTVDPEISIPTGLNATTRKGRIKSDLPSDFVIPGLNLTNAQTVAMDLAEGFERADPGAGNVVHTLFGEGDVRLPAGTYEVTATLGVEYGESAANAGTMSRMVTVTTGTATSAEFHLARAFTPASARSGDFHVHAAKSPDSAVPMADRVISFAASGIEILAGTDHDVIADYVPVFNSLASVRPDLGRRLNVINGIESTAQVGVPKLFTQSIGHYNAYPLQQDGLKRKGGAPEDEFRPPAVLYGQLRALAPTGTSAIVQLNHPRSRLTSLPIGGEGLLHNLSFQFVPSATTTNAAALAVTNFATAFVDATSPAEAGLSGSSVFFSSFAALGADFRGSPDPDPALGGRDAGTPGAHAINAQAIDLMNKGTLTAFLAGTLLELPTKTLIGSLGFDTLEVMTGAALEESTKLLDIRLDWFNLLNFGIVRTAVANTDTHRMAPRANFVIGSALTGAPLGDDTVGFPRNYLLFKSGTPQAGAVAAADIVGALGRAFDDASTWSLTTQVPDISDLTKRTSGGRNVCTTGPFIDLAIKGTNASAVTVSGIVGDLVNLTGTAFTVSLRIERAAWVPVDEVRVIVNGAVAVTVPASVVLAAQGASSRFETAIPFAASSSMSRDFWVLVEAGQTLSAIAAGTSPTNVSGQPKYTDIAPGIMVHSFTNPVFVDRDGNGTWKAPADATP